jgi:tRNA 2-thiouridine synthesizing protein A
MIDARGYACPMPVVMVQKAVKDSAPRQLEVLVDNRCAVENVTRFATNQGYQVKVTDQGDDEFTLSLSK